MPDAVVRILGIDPGMGNLGVSKLLYDPDRGYNLVGVKLISTKKEDKKRGLRQKADDTRRLGLIVDQFDEIIRHWPPDVCAFEAVPSLRHATASKKVALAWGACFALVARREGVLVFEYEPMDLKVTITGDRQASKEKMISTLGQRFPVLADCSIPKSKKEHVADATAAALKAAQDPAVVALASAMRRVTS